MCDECKCHEHGKGLFSRIHGNIETEFKHLNINIPDDENTKEKRLAYQQNPTLDNFLLLGGALGFQMRYRESIPLYEKMLKKYPTNFDLNRRLALLYLKTLDMEHALTKFEYCLEYTPDKLDVTYRIGLCNYYMHRYDKAYDAFLKCFDLASNNPSMYVATLCWFHLCCVNLNTGFDVFDKYVGQYDFNYGTHPGYNLYVQLVANKITIEEFNVKADELSELNQTCAWYSASVYFKDKDQRRSRIYSHLCLSNEDYFGSFSYIACYIDKNKIVF